MSFQTIKKLLDRPGTRMLLGYLVSLRANLGKGVHELRIFYDDCWIHKFSNGYFIADWEPKSNIDINRQFAIHREYWFSLYRPQPGETVIDVGAGIGYETILFARAVGPHGRVLSIEAHPKTQKCLKKTCQYNGLKNVSVLHAALVDSPKKVYLSDLAHHKSNTLINGQGATFIEVPGDTLDSICKKNGIGFVHFLKMNIEGAERFAIKGMDKIISNVAYIAIACHDFKAAKTEEDFYRTQDIITEFLIDHGFKIVDIPFEKIWAQHHVYAYNSNYIKDFKVNFQ